MAKKVREQQKFHLRDGWCYRFSTQWIKTPWKPHDAGHHLAKIGHPGLTGKLGKKCRGIRQALTSEKLDHAKRIKCIQMMR